MKHNIPNTILWVSGHLQRHSPFTLTNTWDYGYQQSIHAPDIMLTNMKHTPSVWWIRGINGGLTATFFDTKHPCQQQSPQDGVWTSLSSAKTWQETTSRVQRTTKPKLYTAHLEEARTRAHYTHMLRSSVAMDAIHAASPVTFPQRRSRAVTTVWKHQNNRIINQAVQPNSEILARPQTSLALHKAERVCRKMGIAFRRVSTC